MSGGVKIPYHLIILTLVFFSNGICAPQKIVIRIDEDVPGDCYKVLNDLKVICFS